MSALSSSFMDFVRSLNRAAKRRLNRKLGMVIAVSDVQWGDCGKAAVLSYVCELLCKDDLPFVAVRFQGGSNAGHTVVIDEKKHVTHMIPVSILYGAYGAIGSNCVVLPHKWDSNYPDGLKEEVEGLATWLSFSDKPLIIDPDASVTCPWHIELERQINTLGGGVGSTGRGIAPTYESIAGKWRITVSDCLSRSNLTRAFEQIKPQLKLRGLEHMLTQEAFKRLVEWGKWLQSVARIERVDAFLRNWQRAGKHILLEGAQGAHLDVLRDSPCSTSSSPWPPIGIGQLENIIHIGVFKIPSTRVGEGAFPGEIFGEGAERKRRRGGEFGSTTGRPRRMGDIIMSSIREGCERMGVHVLCLTKADLLVGETVEAFDRLNIDGYPVDWWGSARRAWDAKQLSQCDRGITLSGSFQLPTLDRPFTGVQEWRRLPRSAQELVIGLQVHLPTPIIMMKTGPGSWDMAVRKSR